MLRSIPRFANTSAKYYEKNVYTPLRNLLPQSFQDKLKQLFLYRPDDVHDLHQVPPANMKLDEVKRIQGYRYPAPGSQSTVRVPETENEELDYDIKYFSRNTRRMGHLDEKGYSMDPSDVIVNGKEIAPPDEDTPLGSPGTHYTAATVKAYDPSGLRSAMTATHAETFKAVQAHMPNHNVKYIWENDMDRIVDFYESRGLPPVVGYDFEDMVESDAKKGAW
uniref:Uncharacterized protein n=1 Tax=Rhizochromulina marina TaxID=1034831 RepID=A0A7S2WMS8_9STRA|mmetsp:Transcript_29166/g.85123  ORF Transcript_29166/g.85123 Transcript_29166/m.85123 type:complete len:221 (+) Transcript_29166:52-714(+)|eukprot:CAMPEP_0118973772 /NCGR_PEP_ID=MMETSP1173-20130426/10901_1 /TAXON_ID=1034831 /ORGANISM="Rhizochromulina marina cf, Strain CCMP1243" /LENGTH=220 /DNA_ID=CAMNT_0006923465 /DNA_START=28 /DNA_END=690 /DNA_ORIENTATION=-